MVKIRKKMLIGSIIAVVILTLVSFSSVVGYRSVKSDSKIASPLFGIRTNRAINKKQDAVTSDYIGKGKTINIILPRRNIDVELVEKFINIIKMMNDNTFDRFVDSFIKRLIQKNNFQEFNNEATTVLLNQLRDNPNEIKPYTWTLNKDETKLWTQNCQTIDCTIGYDIECLMDFILWLMVLPFYMVYYLIYLALLFFLFEWNP